MADALKPLPQSSHPDLLVGFNTADDAGVFRISDRVALVQTVDFFPPIVDDPYYFGQIAAANALSDVFAMGGTPVTALNIVGFPTGTMPPEILTDILRGGSEKVEEAGAVIAGGHSIKDRELKYGLAVTGLIDPDRIIFNSGARVGDRLYLTKPLGTGLITTGIKKAAIEDEVIELVVHQMAELNDRASVLMRQHHASAATDITGFGLLGHASEMAVASSKTFRFNSESIPLLPGVFDLVDRKMIPGGTNNNRNYMQDKVTIEHLFDPRLEVLLYDPQTSGGLLVAIPEEEVDDFENDLRSAGLVYQSVGMVESRSDVPIIVC